MDSTPPSLELFATPHLVAVGVILAVCLAVPLAVRHRSRRGSTKAIRTAGRWLAVLVVAQELVKIWALVEIYERPLKYHLPLHLCGVAVFLAAVVLITRNHRLFEVVYFWGLGGTLQAILTPDMPYGYPHPAFFAFFISHGAILLAASYAVLAMGLRPTWMSVFRVWLITNLYALLVAGVNLLLNANYLYLRAKPSSASLLDHLGPWPWYLVALEGIALVSFIVYYLPFAIYDFVQSRPRPNEAGQPTP